MEDISLNTHISPIIPSHLPQISNPSGRGALKRAPMGSHRGRNKSRPLHLFVFAFDGIVVRSALIGGIALIGATAEVSSRATGASTSTGLAVN
jgi:hypothetical protein